MRSISAAIPSRWEATSSTNSCHSARRISSNTGPRSASRISSRKKTSTCRARTLNCRPFFRSQWPPRRATWQYMFPTAKSSVTLILTPQAHRTRPRRNGALVLGFRIRDVTPARSLTASNTSASTIERSGLRRTTGFFDWMPQTNSPFRIGLSNAPQPRLNNNFDSHRPPPGAGMPSAFSDLQSSLGFLPEFSSWKQRSRMAACSGLIRQSGPSIRSYP